MSLLTMTPGNMTGTATYALGLVRSLAAPGSSIVPTVIVNRLMRGHVRGLAGGASCVTELRTIPLRDTPTWRLALIAQAVAARGTLARQLPPGLDLIHYPLTLPFPSAELPAVVTVHDLQHHDLPEFFSRKQHLWRRRTYDAPAKAAALVIAVSEFARLTVIDRLGIPPERIAVAAAAVDHEIFHPGAEKDEAVLRPLRLPPRFVIYPAALLAHKNHGRLVEALARLEHTDVSLLLTGPGFGRLDELMGHASSEGVRHRVRHLGFVSRAQLAALYRRAEALVFPSLYEGFGAPPLEAMACGCPVVSSVEGSLPETCGEAALFCDARSVHDMGRALDRVLEDGGLRAQLRERGLARAREFTWRAAAERHAAAYRRALELA